MNASKHTNVIEPVHEYVKQIHNPASMRQLNARLLAAQSHEEALHVLASPDHTALNPSPPPSLERL